MDKQAGRRRTDGDAKNHVVEEKIINAFNNKGFTLLEILMVMAMMGLLYVSTSHLWRNAQNDINSAQVYKDIRSILDYYLLYNTCAAGNPPADKPQVNPINGAAYAVSCGKRMVQVSTNLPSDNLSYFSKIPAYVSGNTVTVFEVWRVIGDAGYERETYYEQPF